MMAFYNAVEFSCMYELPSLIASEMVSTIPSIVRHVHSAATPSGNPFGIL